MIPGDVGTVVDAVWYSDAWWCGYNSGCCIIQWWLIHYGSNAWAAHAVLVCTCVVHQTLLYHTPDFIVSYPWIYCVIHQTPLYYARDSTVSYRTSLCHAPDPTVSTPDPTISPPDSTVWYTWVCCIIHLSRLCRLYHTPASAVSRTKPCIHPSHRPVDWCFVSAD